MVDAVTVRPADEPVVRRVPMDRPWAWLAAGWDDLRAAGPVSVAYASGIVALGLALMAAVAAAERAALVLPLAAGFLLVAPALATGLYEVSRRIAAGQRPTLAGALLAFRGNATQLAMMGLLLALIHVAWLRIAVLLYALLAPDPVPSWDRLVPDFLVSPAGLPLLVAGTAVGAALAAVTFAATAIAIPMLLDRAVSMPVAVITSLRAVHANPLTMAFWAALIVVFTLAGIATLTLGLAVMLPLVGHASWHAYRDLVEPS